MLYKSSQSGAILACDDLCVDFRLVASYLPILLLMLRANLLLGGLEFLNLAGFAPNMVMLTAAVLVFWDFYANRNSQVSTLCGGLLIPITVAFTTRYLVMDYHRCSFLRPAFACDSMQSFALELACDAAFAVACSYQLCCLAFQPAYGIKGAPILWSVLCVGKCWILCAPLSAIEVVVRTTIFYVAYMLLLYAAPFLPTIDRKIHRLTAPLICVHLLLVQWYIVFGSILVYVIVLTKIYTRDTLAHASRTMPQKSNCNQVHTPIHTPPSTQAAQADITLIEQLRRAKAQKDKVDNIEHIGQ